MLGRIVTSEPVETVIATSAIGLPVLVARTTSSVRLPCSTIVRCGKDQ